MIKESKKQKKEKKEKKVYRDGLGEIKNPTETVWGKVLIWILAFLMFGSIVITFFWLLWELIF